MVFPLWKNAGRLMSRVAWENWTLHMGPFQASGWEKLGHFAFALMCTTTLLLFHLLANLSRTCDRIHKHDQATVCGELHRCASTSLPPTTGNHGNHGKLRDGDGV